MPTYSITNLTPSVLDMSPLRDLAGTLITLKPQGKKGDAVEIDDETLGNPVCQRVLAMKWIDVSMGAQNADAPAPAPAANVPAADVEEVVAAAPKADPLPETPTETPAETPVEVAAVETTTETPAAATPHEDLPLPTSSMPVETSTSSETPMRSSGPRFSETVSPKNKKK